jgi:uncharacterized protein YjiS (DUF1127 family)
MRDYIVNEVQSRQAYGSVTWLVRLVGNWRMRKTLRMLRKWSNYKLRDIGLERSELERLIAAPLDYDHEWHRLQIRHSRECLNPLGCDEILAFAGKTVVKEIVRWRIGINGFHWRVNVRWSQVQPRA